MPRRCATARRGRTVDLDGDVTDLLTLLPAVDATYDVVEGGKGGVGTTSGRPATRPGSRCRPTG